MWTGAKGADERKLGAWGREKARKGTGENAMRVSGLSGRGLRADGVRGGTWGAAVWNGQV